jgi:hypothetical protein
MSTTRCEQQGNKQELLVNKAIRLTNKVQATNSKQGAKVKAKKQTRVAR